MVLLPTVWYENAASEVAHAILGGSVTFLCNFRSPRTLIHMTAPVMGLDGIGETIHHQVALNHRRRRRTCG
jgi:hypothetical protein